MIRLVLAFLLLAGPVYAQMESSPGSGPVNISPRGSSNLNWSGLHNAQPEQALVDGVNIYPPSSSGIYTEVVGGASHVIRCPLSIASVDNIIFEITEGANVISFDATCWGWVGNTPPTFTVNGYDEVVCHSRTPTVINIAQFTCNPLLNVGFKASPVWVRGALGSFVTSGTTSTVTVSAVSGQSLLCAVLFAPQSTVTLTSASDGTSNLTLSDNGIGGSVRGQIAYEVPISGHSVSTITFTYSAAVVDAQAVCDVISGATILVAGGHALNVQSNPGSGTDAVTTGSVTSASGALVWGAAGNSGGSTTVAGTGFTQHEHDTGGTAWNFTTETKISIAGTDAATFTSNNGSGTNYFNGALVVQ